MARSDEANLARGRYIAQRRHDLGIGVEQLAQRIGEDRKLIQRIEDGKGTSLEKWVAIARELDTTAEDLALVGANPPQRQLDRIESLLLEVRAVLKPAGEDAAPALVFDADAARALRDLVATLQQGKRLAG